MASNPALSYPARPKAALEWARQVTRTHSKTFYLGSLLYPPGQREAVWAVYAACRVGDDIADEQTGAGAWQNLLAWRAEVRSAFAGEAGQSEMQRALAWAAGQYAIPLSAFEELFEGFCMDLRGQAYDTMDDLRLYCRRVAGVVGLMIAPISGYRGGQATLDGAVQLGEAMQLTNILRDVGEDLRRGRVYLPRELLEAYGVSPAELQAGQRSPEYSCLLRHLADEARAWYALGESHVPQLDGRSRVGVAAAARAYAAILTDLENNAFDNLTYRAHVSGWHKLKLLWGAQRDFREPVDVCPVSWLERQYARLSAARSVSPTESTD